MARKESGSTCKTEMLLPTSYVAMSKSQGECESGSLSWSEIFFLLTSYVSMSRTQGECESGPAYQTETAFLPTNYEGQIKLKKKKKKKISAFGHCLAVKCQDHSSCHEIRE